MSNDIYFMEGYNDALSRPISMADCPYSPISEQVKYSSWIEGYRHGCYESRRPFKDPEFFQHTLERLSVMNPARCKAFGHSVESMSLTFWSTAVSGEVGELLIAVAGHSGLLCNLVKKQERGDGDKKLEIAKEAADIVIYLDLLCTHQGIDLCEAIRNKFNEVSDKAGSNIKF